MNEVFETKSLFGGAVEISLPMRFTDTSTVRHVADAQEVYSDADSDQSIILEFLAYNEVDDNHIAQYLFDDIADLNSAKNKRIFECNIDTNLGLQDVSIVLYGQQSVSKYNEDAVNVITMYLGVVRLKKYHTDMLLTVNVPVGFSPNSSSNSTSKLYPFNSEMFLRIFRSIKILNFDLLNCW
ncbi:RanGEF [Acrasis kona]|uniref:RanGEF n=1 Tax=Acrasis kona TaxID=1008807 RepID=A0AAW2YXS4_9EUKA